VKSLPGGPGGPTGPGSPDIPGKPRIPGNPRSPRYNNKWDDAVKQLSNESITVFTLWFRGGHQRALYERKKKKKKTNKNKERRMKTSPAWVFSLKNTERLIILKLSRKKTLPPKSFARTGLHPRSVCNWRSAGNLPHTSLCLGDGANWITDWNGGEYIFKTHFWHHNHFPQEKSLGNKNCCWIKSWTSL